MHAIIHLSRTIKSTIPRVDSNVSYEPLVIAICLCRFISYDTCITVVGVFIMGRSAGGSNLWCQMLVVS
jgi:hypothetical protein